MSGIKAWHAGVLAVAIFGVIVTVIAGTGTARAQDDTSVLHDSPVLVVDPGMHTAIIRTADVDTAAQIAVTGSFDKTVRLWSLDPLKLERTIRISSGPGNVGKIYAVAISPDGKVIAASGWTGAATGRGVLHKIYLFDRGGKLLGRIDGLPNVVLRLTFSPHGRFLAVGLFGANGIRIYGRKQDWREVARDTDYGDHVYGITFATDHRLATTSRDGHVRLYDQDFTLIRKRKTNFGDRPFGIAFNRDGTKLAFGFADTAVVVALDGHSLEQLTLPDTTGLDNDSLFHVAWSQDGKTLYAGGGPNVDGYRRVIVWEDAGLGERRSLISGAINTIFSIKPLPGGAMLVAAGDPHLAHLAADGTLQRAVASPKFDARGQEQVLSVSADGTQVDFAYEQWGKRLARFDLKTLKLDTPDRPTDDLTAAPKQVGLNIGNWKNRNNPNLNGTPLPLNQFETSRSLAIHPDGKRFVLGTEWSLRVFDVEGTELWRRAAPSIGWAVNITGDGRLVVAAYGDGTIRWYRMDDGRELLAFFPMTNKKDWVAWTPEGFYASTAGASGVLK